MCRFNSLKSCKETFSVPSKYVFYSSYGETYEWVVDLKEMQAQRILNSYCAQLSRVGLNESEWLRLIAKQ